LGLFPGTETMVTLRSGRFGPYVQLGEDKKPKRSGLPKGTDPAEVDLAMAVKLLSLPREVGAASRRRQDDHGEFRPLWALRRP
jgi:DNA topoisomerase-1